MLSIGKTITMLIAGSDVTVKGHKRNEIYFSRTDFTEARIGNNPVNIELINELFHHQIIEADSGNLETGERHLKWCMDAYKLTI